MRQITGTRGSRGQPWSSTGRLGDSRVAIFGRRARSSSSLAIVDGAVKFASVVVSLQRRRFAAVLDIAENPFSRFDLQSPDY